MSNDERLVHLIYTSAATSPFSAPDLKALLVLARQNNAKLSVSGMLLHDQGSFFQILEGEEQSVLSLFNKISTDRRHSAITKLIFEPIEKRDFAQWTMGFAGLTLKDLNSVEGLNDFFLQGKLFTNLEAGRARSLLSAFKDGRWRSAIK